MSEQASERLYGSCRRSTACATRRREPLRALLGVIEAELDRVEGDIDQLYDDWFIETCEEWVVPYIGDLLGVPGLHPLDVAGLSLRSYVANTLRYRRRKGTASVLEQLAHDVTGWPAHAVEFFRLLATAGQMNYPRTNAALRCATVRSAAARRICVTLSRSIGSTDRSIRLPIR